jgi:Raf kinase inhibitor-like YbhB/YbcL family protein
MRPLALVLALSAALVLAACGGEEKVKDGLPAAPDEIKLSSPAIVNGGLFGKQFTCDGAGTPPPLAMSGVPSGADSLALILEDPDAPDGTYVHWTVFDINTGERKLTPGALPAGAVQGDNSSGKLGYGPPCPPQGDPPHHYVFALYALSASPGLDSGAKPADVVKAIERTASARGVMNATYKR